MLNKTFGRLTLETHFFLLYIFVLIVEGIKTFKGMIKGFELIIHTDHLNLLHMNLPNKKMIMFRVSMKALCFKNKVYHWKQ